MTTIDSGSSWTIVDNGSILLVSKMSKASAQIYRYLNVQYMDHYW
jgi:hypothetical protein